MADGGNGGPLANLEGYLKELDVQFDELDSLRSAYMIECKGPRGQIKEIMASAKEAGINMKSFRAIVRKHSADRRHDKFLQGLDIADLSDYKSMEEALGPLLDTPLGQAAVKRAEESEIQPATAA